MGVDFVGFAYAATVAAGGIMGFVKAQSMPSLAAGLTFGTLLAIGAIQTSQDPNKMLIALSGSTFMSGLMGYRFINSGKFMPAGLVAVISIANVVRLGARYVGQAYREN